MTLQEIGWNEFFAQQVTTQDLAEFVPARVLEEQKNYYFLQTAVDTERVLSQVAGKMMHENKSRQDYPAVGDWVLCRVTADRQSAKIHKVLKRKSVLVRQSDEQSKEQVLAANVDTVFVVTSFNQDFNLSRLERYVAMIRGGGAVPVVVINKADLCSDPEPFLQQTRTLGPDIPFFAVSAVQRQGLDIFLETLAKGQTIVLVGSSGVGKSTLINQIYEQQLQKVQEVRIRDDKGRHTTSYRTLFFFPKGGSMIDTPGIRELFLAPAKEDMEDSFEDIQGLSVACQFSNCGHEAEKDCAVKKAVEKGTLSPKRLGNYHKLLKEQGQNVDKEYARRKQQRLSGKAVKRVAKDKTKS